MRPLQVAYKGQSITVELPGATRMERVCFRT
jgi:hypothetical protein